MKITPGVGVAIGMGVAAAAVGIGLALGTHRNDSGGPTPYSGPVPSPRPGPAPTPSPTTSPTSDAIPYPLEPEVLGTGNPLLAIYRVDDLADMYLDRYDHSGDGTIDIGWGQQFGSDERVTGDVGNVHTMVEFFRDADVDGNELVTRDELRGAIAVFDTEGTTGFNPMGAQLGDGILGRLELREFKDQAIQSHSDPLDWVDEKGVPQIVIAPDGEYVNNQGFFDALPEYRALD